MTDTLIAYRWQLRKLATQRRSWLGIVAAALVPIPFVFSILASKITLRSQTPAVARARTAIRDHRIDILLKPG